MEKTLKYLLNISNMAQAPELDSLSNNIVENVCNIKVGNKRPCGNIQLITLYKDGANTGGYATHCFVLGFPVKCYQKFLKMAFQDHQTFATNKCHEEVQNKGWYTTGCELNATVPVLINKILSEHNHARLFLYCPWLLSCYNSTGEYLQHKPHKV